MLENATNTDWLLIFLLIKRVSFYLILRISEILVGFYDNYCYFNGLQLIYCVVSLPDCLFMCMDISGDDCC